MKIAPIPSNEEQRLRNLYSYEILDSAPEDEFNDLVELASAFCKTPISLITLLDKERQWFKARKGVDLNETEKGLSFCTHAILTDDVMVVEDTAKDSRFSDNPLVTNYGIRFYAGAPIVSPEGHKLGTVCVLDHEPQQFTKEQKRNLELISKQVTKLLDLRQKNILIRKKAEESIAYKSQLISRVLIDNENDKRTIANNLHEDLAQRMVYCIHALGGKSAALHLHVIRDEMNRILTDLRELTYSISPVTDHQFAPGELIDDFINRVAVTFPFELVLKKSNADECFNPRVSLSLIRMMEEWFRLLLKKQQVSLVEVEVRCEHDHIQLTIEDNGKLANGFTQKQQERIGIIQERVQMEEGSLSFHHKPGKSVLKIELPLPAERIAGTA
ncbi:MAG TPA: GAF domain-containing protein [Lacibacter sp.]|nr:GAF domain-containing protein [Lacibacter sp.]